MKVSDTDIKGQLELFLGDDYDKFMELKPQMKHASALVQNANQYYEEAFGNPGNQTARKPPEAVSRADPLRPR